MRKFVVFNSPANSPRTNEQQSNESNTLIDKKFILIALPYGKHIFKEAIFLLLLTEEKSILCIKSIFKHKVTGFCFRNGLLRSLFRCRRSL
jgi:hypothetical protein